MAVHIYIYLSIHVLCTDDIVPPVLNDTVQEILAQKEEVARLKTVMDQHPFYKYNGVWTRELQNLVFTLATPRFYRRC